MSNELKRIRLKYSRKDNDDKNIKPYFFSHISKMKGYYDSNKNNYLSHKSTMDYLEKIINQYQRSRTDKKNEFIRFYEILDTSDYDIKKAKYDQVNRIIDIVTSLKDKGKEIFSNHDNENSHEDYNAQRQQCIDYIGKIKFSKNTMIYMLQILDTEKYKYVYRMVFNILFGYPNTDFYNVIIDQNEDLKILKLYLGDAINPEINEEIIEILGIFYSKTYKNRQKRSKNQNLTLEN